MIDVFLGEDAKKARESARNAFQLAREEYPDASVTLFDNLTFDVMTANELFNAENLFGGVNILYFDSILEHPEGESFYRTSLKESEHIIIVRETNPPKDLKAFFERIGNVKEFPLFQPVAKRENSFALADAIGIRDKKGSWVEFEKIRRHGGVMEEIHGTVFWAVKTMYLVATLSKADAIATGMKEYTYKNYYSYSKKYSVQELETKLRTLKDMYHLAHRGEGEFTILMEQFVLDL